MVLTRFMRKGTTKVFFVATVAAAPAITASEVNAGINCTPQIMEMNGFTFANNPISTPDMDSRFVTQVPGEDTAETSNLVMYERKGGSDTIKAALVKDATGYLVIFPTGIAGASPAAADKAEAWPVTISSNVRRYTAGNEAAQYQANFAITAQPFDVTLT